MCDVLVVNFILFFIKFYFNNVNITKEMKIEILPSN